MRRESLTGSISPPGITRCGCTGTLDCDIYLTDPQFGIPAALNGYAQKISSYAPADSDILNDQVVLRPFNVLGSNEYLICTSDNYIIPSGACYIYPDKRVYLSQSGKFSEAAEYAGTPKLIALTENGCLFDPELAFRDQAPWLWFCTWSGEFVIRSGMPLLSEEYTEEAMVKKVYDDERVITLDELPDWKHYSRD